MTSYKPVLLLLGVVTMMSPSAGATAQATAEQIVNGFYPVDRLSPYDASHRQSCFGVLSTTGTAAPAVIVAAYTDRSNGVISLITGEPAVGYQVAYELPWSFNLHGNECSVDLIDLNFDGRAEVVVAFTASRGGESVWLFLRSRTRLTSITPVRERTGRHNSLLVNPNITDLTHQAWMQIVIARDAGMLEDDAPTPYAGELYEFKESTYRRTGYVLEVATFRAGNDPRSWVSHFRQSEDSQGPFVVRVVNGDRFGRHRVTSASVVLNGNVIISSVTKQMEFSEPVVLRTLPIENTMTVNLNGDPDATITVVVSDSTVR